MPIAVVLNTLPETVLPEMLIVSNKFTSERISLAAAITNGKQISFLIWQRSLSETYFGCRLIFFLCLLLLSHPVFRWGNSALMGYFIFNFLIFLTVDFQLGIAWEWWCILYHFNIAMLSLHNKCNALLPNSILE